MKSDREKYISEWHQRALDLEDGIAQRDQRIKELENLLHISEAPPIKGFSRSEATILKLLLINRMVHRKLIMAALYPYAALETKREKTIDVFVCDARKKLTAYGIKIYSLHSYGYCIHEEDREKLKAIIYAAPSSGSQSTS
jgi:DNA-binding response OmpR family regulator